MSREAIRAEIVDVHVATNDEQRARLAEVFDLWFVGKSHNTELSYRRSLAEFAEIAGHTDEIEFAGWLLLRTPQQAALLMMRYRAHLDGRGCSPQTINNRLSAVRSWFRHGRDLGLVAFTPTVKWARAKKYRDTAGPGIKGVRAMLAACDGSSPKDVRNRALIWCLFGRGLRAFEVCGLDLEHVDLERQRLSVLGKRRDDREWLTISSHVTDALARHLAIRGESPGPVFTGRNPANRLATRSLYELIRRIGKRAGLMQRVTPHGLRHSACTFALDSGADLRSVQAFMRHANPATVKIYDDNRQDLAGGVANLIAELGEGPRVAG